MCNACIMKNSTGVEEEEERLVKVSWRWGEQFDHTIQYQSTINSGGVISCRNNCFSIVNHHNGCQTVGFDRDVKIFTQGFYDWLLKENVTLRKKDINDFNYLRQHFTSQRPCTPTRQTNFGPHAKYIWHIVHQFQTGVQFLGLYIYDLTLQSRTFSMLFPRTKMAVFIH